jgi:hypothetical protein
MLEGGFESPRQKEKIPLLTVLEKEPRIPRTKLSADEKEQLDIQIEENKKLATAICDKYKKGDVFDFYLEKRHNLYSIILEGAQVGTFGIRDNGDTKQVAIILINDALKNKGFAKQLYIRLNDYFEHLDGSVLMTDNMKVSEDATHLWESLYKSGIVEKLDEKALDGRALYKFKK